MAASAGDDFDYTAGLAPFKNLIAKTTCARVGEIRSGAPLSNFNNGRSQITRIAGGSTSMKMAQDISTGMSPVD